MRVDVARAAARAADHLAAGGLLVHPTTGVYGLGGARTREVEREVARCKGRAEGSPLIYLVEDVSALRREFPQTAWPALAARLAEAFWPGPLTMILGDGTGRGRSVRCEGHPATRAVLAAWGRALSSTSLNRSGCPPAYSSDDVRGAVADLDPPVRRLLVLDAGDLPGPPPSTLVRVSGERWELLREGAIRRETIEEAIRE